MEQGAAAGCPSMIQMRSMAGHAAADGRRNCRAGALWMRHTPHKLLNTLGSRGARSCAAFAHRVRAALGRQHNEG